MTRDEILRKIESLSVETDHFPSTALDVADAMRETLRLADEYEGDPQYLAEATASAMESFADMLVRLSGRM